MKICPNCGETENPDVAKFCRICRHEFENKSKVLKSVITGLAVLVFLGGVAYFAYPYLATTAPSSTVKPNDSENDSMVSVQESAQPKGKEQVGFTENKEKTTTNNNSEKQQGTSTTTSQGTSVPSNKIEDKKQETVAVIESSKLPEKKTKVYGSGTYTGMMLDGKGNGQGIFVWNNGDKYEGNFVNDKMDGQGVYYRGNEWRHVGSFKDGKPHGEGIRYTSKGKSTKGIWENGDFKSALK